MVIAQGEIWWADLPAPTGSGPGLRGPVLSVRERLADLDERNSVLGPERPKDMSLDQVREGKSPEPSSPGSRPGRTGAPWFLGRAIPGTKTAASRAMAAGSGRPSVIEYAGSLLESSFVSGSSVPYGAASSPGFPFVR